MPETELVGKYTDRLIEDIKTTLPRDEKIPVDTVYFGGGTPSLLQGESVKRIVICLKDNAEISDNAEITLEMNPEDVDDSKISEFKSAGVNRIVLGVQTLCQDSFDIIGRSGKLCTTDVLDVFFSKTGFTHGIDLIAGIPGQTPGSMMAEIERLIKYQPAHISAYILSVEKGTPVYKRIIRDEAFEKMQVDVFRSVIDSLENAGYEHYEISNFALAGNKSRHNMKYWKYEPYIGFGPSSHSFFRNERYSIDMTVSDYINSNYINKNIDERNSCSAVAEILLTGLRLSDGILLEEIAEKSGMPVPAAVMNRLESLATEGKINITPAGGISINREYFFLADSIIYEAVQDII
jgi:oxygen-independent coproporphyrinogen-3 oxidase